MFSERLRVKFILSKPDDTETRIATYFPTFLEAMFKAINNNYLTKLQSYNFLSLKVNLRMSFKFKKWCSICGTTGTVSKFTQSHHMRYI
jgi:hypothetical protein